MGCSIGPGRGRRGGICRSGSGPGRPSTTGIGAGQRTERGSGSCRRCRPAVTRPRAGPGRSRWTPRSCGRISTPPAPGTPRPRMSTPIGGADAAGTTRRPSRTRGAARMTRIRTPPTAAPVGTGDAGTVPRRPDHQDSSRRGPSRSALWRGSPAPGNATTPSASAGHGRIRIARRDPAGPAPDPAGCWPIRPTPAAVSAPTCADVASRPSSPNPPTRPATACGAAAGRPATPPRHRRPTGCATPSNAPSTSCTATAPSPPATTNATTSTAEPSTRLHRHLAPRPRHMIYGTRSSSRDASGTTVRLASPGQKRPPRYSVEGDRERISNGLLPISRSGPLITELGAAVDRIPE